MIGFLLTIVWCNPQVVDNLEEQPSSVSRCSSNGTASSVTTYILFGSYGWVRPRIASPLQKANTATHTIREYLYAINVFENVWMAERLEPQVSWLGKLDLRKWAKLSSWVKVMQSCRSTHFVWSFVSKVEDKYCDRLTTGLRINESYRAHSRHDAHSTFYHPFTFFFPAWTDHILFPTRQLCFSSMV